MKKILALILAVVFVLSLCAMPALAAEDGVHDHDGECCGLSSESAVTRDHTHVFQITINEEILAYADTHVIISYEIRTCACGFSRTVEVGRSESLHSGPMVSHTLYSDVHVCNTCGTTYYVPRSAG